MKNRKFDCVKMKDDIQRKLVEEMKKFSSEAEYRRAKREELMKDPRFAKMLEKFKDLDDSAA